jgi:ankyrin repeat protein
MGSTSIHFGKYSDTALQLAIVYYHEADSNDGSKREERLRLIQLLINHGADVNGPAADFRGGTALQRAILHYESGVHKRDPLELVTFLLERGADVKAPPAKVGGVTAFQGAAIKGHLKIAHMLLERDADPNAPGSQENGRTALEGAAEWGRLDMVQLLLNAGAIPTQSALAFAELRKNFVIADIIKEEMIKRDIENNREREQVQVADVGEGTHDQQTFFGQQGHRSPRQGYVVEQDDLGDLYSAD